MTVSFWAKGTNPPGYGYWAMQLWQRFGTGGSPSSPVQNNKELKVTSYWKKYTFTYELASLSGKTLGSNNDDHIDLIIRQHASDNNTGAWELNIANVQVELGRNATEFEHRHYGEELTLCQRYYERHNFTASQYMAVSIAHNNAANGSRFVFQFLTRKRSTNPSVTFTGNFSAYPPGEAATLTGAEDNDVSSRVNVVRSTAYGQGYGNLILAQSGAYAEIEDEL